jgi:hypothetical protein
VVRQAILSCEKIRSGCQHSARHHWSLDCEFLSGCCEFLVQNIYVLLFSVWEPLPGLIGIVVKRYDHAKARPSPHDW